MRITKQKLIIATLLAGLGSATVAEAAVTYALRLNAPGVRAAVAPDAPGAQPSTPTTPTTPAADTPAPAPAPTPTGPFQFTTCGAVGISGPTASQCDTAYAGTALAGLVVSSGGIQTFTVPTTATYTLKLAGAAGGSPSSYPGGKGAVLTTTLSLTQGTVLKILVGQAGSASGTYTTIVGGGGGGTFVVAGSTALAVAGGGGAGGASGGAGYDASTTTAPTATRGTGLGWGGGGAGFSANGVQGTGSLAYSFLAGGAGGDSTRAVGGFGGGGGGGQNGGGGGGGYSVGNQGGAGGTTYSSGAIVSSVASNTGAGYVIITKN